MVKRHELISQRTQLLFKSTNMIAQLQSQLDNLWAAVEILTTCTLISYLLSHTTLQNILDHVSQTLRDQGHTLHLIYTHPIHYYTHANFIYWREDHNLFITLKLPLTAYDVPFDVFRIIHTPNPLHNDPSYSMSLQNVDHYLLMASNDQVYTTTCSHGLYYTPPNFKSILIRKFSHKTHTTCYPNASQRTDGNTRRRRLSQSSTMTSYVPSTPVLCLRWCYWILVRRSTLLIMAYYWMFSRNVSESKEPSWTGSARTI